MSVSVLVLVLVRVCVPLTLDCFNGKYGNIDCDDRVATNLNKLGDGILVRL